jgi:hypothetical protein
MAIPIIRRDEVPPGEEAMFLKFSCPDRFRFSGGPIDPQPPTRTLRRDLANTFDIELPPEVAARIRTGRDTLRVWIIENPDADGADRRSFPSPIIRTVQGDVVHADVSFSQNTHTIHWHGIDPTPMNDGVGHTSFEATSSFVYQFATHSPGTFIYHCHKNTVLHFILGMYGLLVVDPPNPDPGDPLQAPYPTGGPGFAAVDLSNFPGFPGFDPVNLVVRYDAEALWIAGEFDSVWHEIGHNSFMQDCDEDDPQGAGTFVRDGFLNDFRPDIFHLTGVISEPDPELSAARGEFPEVGRPMLDPRVRVTMGANETLLIRLGNAGYTVQQYTLGLDAIAIGTDGAPFGVPPANRYSAPFLIPAGTPFRLTSARRLDLLVRPTVAGTYPFTVETYDWVRGPDVAEPALFHVARTEIQVGEQNQDNGTGKKEKKTKKEKKEKKVKKEK